MFGDEGKQQVMIAVVFDNLGKGACRAAVQNLDLMLGRRGQGTRNPSSGLTNETLYASVISRSENRIEGEMRA